MIRRSKDRGFADHGWLKSRHTFSFANYYDPDRMGFRSLRVINEDRIEGGTGFGSHPHRDMEIISYVIEGALKHEDSMGNKAVILPGEVQRMSAGNGVIHSERNEKYEEPAHFFQIWILPKSRGGNPGYGQKSFKEELAREKLVLVVSEDGRDNSISINQDADLYLSRLKASETVDFELRPGRGAWVQMIRGEIKINDQRLEEGDGFTIESHEKTDHLKIEALQNSEFMLFDLA